MDPELEAEIEEGKEAARRLIEHAIRMNVSGFSGRHVVQDRAYEVTVRLLPMKPENDDED
jgi:hypothetical protein